MAAAQSQMRHHSRPRVILPVAIACAAALVLASHYFGGFAVPDTDFFEFYKNALSLLQGHLPENLKRLPFFPYVIGLASRLLPDQEPILPAALLLNVLLTPVLLWLVFRIGRRLVGPRAALAVVVLLVVSATRVYTAQQPILETLLVTLVLFTVDLAMTGSRWTYVAAALAGLTRYEAIILGPAYAFQELRGPASARRGALWRGALSVVGPCLWLVLSAQRHAGINPYVQEAMERKGDPTAFLIGLTRVAADPLPGAVWLVPLASGLVTLGLLALIVTGGLRLARRHGTVVTVPATFLLFYTLIHTAFPAYQPRYVLPVLWLAYFAMVAGAEGISERVARGVRLVGGSAGNRWAARLVMLVALLMAVHSLVRLLHEPVALLISWLLVSGAVFLAWPWRRHHWRTAGSLLFCVMLAFGLRSTSLLMAEPWVRDNCAQFRELAKWYRGTAKRGDRMAVTLPWVVRYYSGLPESAFFTTRNLKAKTLDEAIAELRKAGVTYVVWDSDYGRNPTTYHARHFRADLLTQLRDTRPEALRLIHEIYGSSRKDAEVYAF